MVEMVREVVIHLSRHCLHFHTTPYLPITRYFHTSLDLPITRYFYTPTNLHITFHTPIHLHIFTISGVAMTHPLSSLTLSLIDETMVDLVSELGALLAKRPCTLRIRQVLHPSASLALSALFEIAQDLINQLVAYAKRRPKRNIKAPSCGTH